MICKVCGAENEQDNTFCLNCGSRMESSDINETPADIAEENVENLEWEDSSQPSLLEKPIGEPAQAPYVPPIVPAPEPHSAAKGKEHVVTAYAPKGPPGTSRTFRKPIAPDMPGLSFFDGTTGQYFGYLLLFGFLNTLIMTIPMALAALFGSSAVSGLNGSAANWWQNIWDANISLDLSSISTMEIIILVIVLILALLLIWLVTAWMYTVLIRWMSHHTIVNDHRLVFVGRDFDLFKKLVLYSILSIITLGIFTIWVPVKLLKWKAAHTRFAT